MKIFRYLFIFAILSILTSCTETGYKHLLYTIDLDSLMAVQNNRPFTCTGLAYDSHDDEWYVGNIGINAPGDGEISSSIEVFDGNFQKWLRTISLADKYPQMEDIQGICIDPEDKSIWVCSFAENLIRKIDRDGHSCDSLHVKRPTGVAISDGLCWALTPNSLMLMKKNGEIIRTINVKEQAQDQLCIIDNKVLITYGDDYNNNQYLIQLDSDCDIFRKKYILENSYAVEGIVARDQLLYIANDGYYHSAKVPRNLICVYKNR